MHLAPWVSYLIPTPSCHTGELIRSQDESGLEYGLEWKDNHREGFPWWWFCDGFAAQLDYCADERSVDQLGIHDDRHDEVALDFLSLGSHVAGKSITSSRWSLSIFSTEGWLLAWQGFSVILTCKICGDNPVCGLLHSQARFPKYRLPGQRGLHRANLQSTKLRPEGPPACWLWRERGDFKHRQAPNPLVAAALTAPNWTVEVSSLGSL